MFASKKSLAIKEEIFAVCITLFMAFPAYAKDSDPIDPISAGENIYTQICGRCHDVAIGPVIKGRQLPPEYINYVVRHGFRAMPAFPEPYISNEDLQYLGKYIQQSSVDGK